MRGAGFGRPATPDPHGCPRNGPDLATCRAQGLPVSQAVCGVTSDQKLRTHRVAQPQASLRWQARTGQGWPNMHERCPRVYAGSQTRQNARCSSHSKTTHRQPNPLRLNPYPDLMPGPDAQGHGPACRGCHIDRRLGAGHHPGLVPAGDRAVFHHGQPHPGHETARPRRARREGTHPHPFPKALVHHGQARPGGSSQLSWIPGHCGRLIANRRIGTTETGRAGSYSPQQEGRPHTTRLDEANVVGKGEAHKGQRQGGPEPRPPHRFTMSLTTGRRSSAPPAIIALPRRR